MASSRSAQLIRTKPPICSFVSANGPSVSSSSSFRTRTVVASDGGRSPAAPSTTPRCSISSDQPPHPSFACAAADSSPQIISRYFMVLLQEQSHPTDEQPQREQTPPR